LLAVSTRPSTHPYTNKSRSGLYAYISYSMTDIDRQFGMLNIHRCTTCVENLLKEDFDEVGNPREGEGGPDCVSLARQEICRSESGVPVRATRKGLGGREGTGRDPV